MPRGPVSDTCQTSSAKMVYNRCLKTGSKTCRESDGRLKKLIDTELSPGTNLMSQCPFCQYKTIYKVALSRHVRRTHSCAGKKPFICDICEYKCTQNKVFVEHLRIHTGEKPFCCDKCDHKFARKSDYMRHVKLHMGKKPYSCEFCAHKFARNSDLVRHKRTHTGEKPYSCEFCDHKFSRNSDLANHKRTHTGEKPYACTLCEYRCARNSDLFKHNMKAHTGDAIHS